MSDRRKTVTAALPSLMSDPESFFAARSEAAAVEVDPMARPLWETDPDFINPFAEVPEVQTWLTIGERKAIPKEGLISFSAKQKQGKSYSVLALLVPMLTGKQFDTASTTGSVPRLIMAFDTEMGRYSVTHRARMMQDVLSGQGLRLQFTSLKGLNPSEKKAKVEEKINRYNPDIVIIDQAGDFVFDINDSREAQAVGEWLNNIASGRTVLVVIHQNKGKDDDNERGHLGSAINFKVVEAYNVAKDKGVFTVSPKYARDTDTTEAAAVRFALDAEGAIITATDILERGKEKEAERWRNDLRLIFGDDEELSRGELVKRIMSQQGLKESAADAKISIAQKSGAIVKTGTSHRDPWRLTQSPAEDFANIPLDEDDL